MKKSDIISYKEAKEKGLTVYFTGKPCGKNHVCERQTSNRTCISCKNEYTSNSKEAKQQRFKKWYSENKEKKIESNKEWVNENRHKKNANTTKRYTSVKQACPSWLSKDQHELITSFYEKAQSLSTTKRLYNVDHIVPLQGKTVCGLHVPWNLQVVLQFDNIAKLNRYWPDMW